MPLQYFKDKAQLKGLVKNLEKPLPHGWTDLHVAIINESFERVRKLVDACAETTKTDAYGNTAFEYALFMENRAIKDYLKKFPSRSVLPNKTTARFQYTNASTYQAANLDQKGYKGHRENSKKNILKGCDASLDTVMVLGVGHAIEIPMEELARKYKNIILVDVDAKAMEVVVNNMTASLRKKCTQVCLELTGMLGNFSSELEFLKQPSITAIGTILVQYAKLAGDPIKCIAKQLLAHNPSYVISSMLVTQLASHFQDEIVRVFPHLKTELGSQVFQISISILQQQLSLGHMDLLRSICRANGQIYLSIDYKQTFPGGIADRIDPNFMTKDMFNYCKAIFNETLVEWQWQTSFTTYFIKCFLAAPIKSVLHVVKLDEKTYVSANSEFPAVRISSELLRLSLVFSAPKLNYLSGCQVDEKLMARGASDIAAALQNVKKLSLILK